MIIILKHYKQLKFNKYNFSELRKKTENEKISIIKYRKTIFSSILSCIFFLNRNFFFSIILSGIAANYYIKEGNHIKKVQNWIDMNFLEAKNVRILFAMDELKKYVLFHPELKRYFDKENTDFVKFTWAPYKHNSLGSGFKHEDKLRDKRWEIISEIYNEDNDASAKFFSIILFHTPSNFEIEYLRVDMWTPYKKKYTIIDGRRDMKEWVDEIEDEKIDKRSYPQYRTEDKVQY